MTKMLEARLKKQKQLGLWRERKRHKHKLNFASNDYLSLSKHPKVIEAFQQAAKNYGVGSTASQMVCGYTDVHAELEQALADYTGYDKVVLFANGFMANHAVINTLCNRHDVIVADKYCHASMIDAAQASGASLKRYAHGDIQSASQLLETHTPKLIMTDAVFSMQGNLAPLNQLAQLAKQYNSGLYVDDAHGFGVLGDGKGSVAECGLTQTDVPVMMATFGKALGGYGALVAGRADIIDAILQFSRTAIYTTALPAACAAAALAALQIVQEQPWRRQHVLSLASQLQQQLISHAILPSQSAIRSIMIPDSKAMMLAYQALLDSGIVVGAMRPPTVPVKTSRLRLGVCAAHSSQHVEQLIELLSHAIS